MGKQLFLKYNIGHEIHHLLWYNWGWVRQGYRIRTPISSIVLKVRYAKIHYHLWAPRPKPVEGRSAPIYSCVWSKLSQFCTSVRSNRQQLCRVANLFSKNIYNRKWTKSTIRVNQSVNGLQTKGVYPRIKLQKGKALSTLLAPLGSPPLMCPLLSGCSCKKCA